MKSLKNIAIILLFMQSLHGQTQQAHITRGHDKGVLIAIGGGSVGDDIMAEFRKYAGGDSARIVVIPTASEGDFIPGSEACTRIENSFHRHGFSQVKVLHTRDPEKANEDQFIDPLREATGIWFSGGRQWRIADGFLNTRAHEEMFKLLDRGGVIAGSSAGATIQGSYLARGDTRNNQIMMGDHECGLGFISNIAIDQHVLARNRQFDLFRIMDKHPELLGIGIDESTAIIVRGDTLEVIGNSYVLIYDRSFWSREGSELKKLPDPQDRFYFLKSGDRYNMAQRKML